jgi:hypothetical protein
MQRKKTEDSRNNRRQKTVEDKEEKKYTEDYRHKRRQKETNLKDRPTLK